MRTTANAGERLTLEQVADRLGCGRTTVFRLLRERAFPSVKIGRARLVESTDVDRYLEQQRAARP